MKNAYKFARTLEDQVENNILIIDWNYEYSGVVLNLSYTGKGTEKALYKAFVKSIDKAVDDGVLPVQLSAWNWKEWKEIEYNPSHRQYATIETVSEKTMTIFWKSTFVDNFFANKEV